MDQPVQFAAGIVVVACLALWWARGSYGDWHEIWQGVFVEASGAVMDLVVFGIIIGIVSARRERRRQITDQEDLIDDYKKWGSKEAGYRIAGAVRRLNRLGRTSINFVGLELADFSFRTNDIENIANSRFHLGSWAAVGSQDRTVLERVDFSALDCTNVAFSARSPWGRAAFSRGIQPSARFRDCRFDGAILAGATFKGALLAWTEEPPDETGEWVETEDGEHGWAQTYFPPFQDADLAGASFEKAVFRNADFRGAMSLDQCGFAGATGLEGCVFDDEDKGRVMRAAAGGE